MLNEFDLLVEYLESIPTGRVGDKNKLGTLLADCWDQFNGSSAASMVGSKLPGRMEDVIWNPPVLQFKIERHGGTVNGSSRAELHHWDVDINSKTARIVNIGYRQLHPRQGPLDVQPLAEDVAKLIVNHEIDERLKWNSDGSVKVLIGKIIPDDSAQQTVTQRRKRFRKTLDPILANQGWEVVRPNVYRYPDSNI